MNRSTRFRFTVRAIEQLPPCPAEAPGKGYEVSDTEVPGLRLSVSKASGRKTFWLRYVFRARKRAMRLGEFPATSLVSVVTRFDVPLVTYRDGPQRAIAQCKRRQVTMTGGAFA